jgi:hypothetical protein
MPQCSQMMLSIFNSLFILWSSGIFLFCGYYLLLSAAASWGGLPTRWTDDLVKVAGSRWMRAAQDRSSWRTLREAYIQQWTSLRWDDDDDDDCWGTGLPMDYQQGGRAITHHPVPVRIGGCDCKYSGTNGLTCLPKHGGARDNKFLVTHPMTDLSLASAILRRAH